MSFPSVLTSVTESEEDVFVKGPKNAIHTHKLSMGFKKLSCITIPSDTLTYGVMFSPSLELLR